MSVPAGNLRETAETFTSVIKSVWRREERAQSLRYWPLICRRRGLREGNARKDQPVSKEVLQISDSPMMRMPAATATGGSRQIDE
jgi:hypothetical protein